MPQKKKEEKIMAETRRQVFDSLCNFRDLGGYPTENGITQFGVFYRSDLPWHLTGADKRKIQSLGIVGSVDLRDDPEASDMPTEMNTIPGIGCRQIPLTGVSKAVVKDRPGGVSAFEDGFFWGTEYISILENNHAWAKRCMEFMADAQGAVVFHCFTGKDRTGITAALLLGACGVRDEDIAADYSVSSIYLVPVYRYMKEHLSDFADADDNCPFFGTQPENILAVMRHLRREYGGTAAFLHECGVGRDVLAAISSRFVKKT